MQKDSVQAPAPARRLHKLLPVFHSQRPGRLHYVGYRSPRQQDPAVRLIQRRDGVAERTPIQVGATSLNAVEIVSGVKPDDQIILNPPDSIVHGQPVQVVQATLPGDIK